MLTSITRLGTRLTELEDKVSVGIMSRGYYGVFQKAVKHCVTASYRQDVSPANRRHILTCAAGYFCDKIAKSQEVTMIASLTQRV